MRFRISDFGFRICAPLAVLVAAAFAPASALAQSRPRKGAESAKPMPAAKAAANPHAAAVVVVFNANDPDSGELARFYAAKRGIPREQLVGLKCPVKEEISRQEYDGEIAEPLRRAFEKNGWWKLRESDDPKTRVTANKIRFLALIRGMPLKVAAAPPGYVGDSPAGPPAVRERSESAVDSELVALGWNSRSISGALDNPYFRSFSRIADARLPGLMLVARLDAATPETVRRMITDSLAAEEKGLAGFAYVDARGIQEPGLVEGDKWLLSLAADARRRGTPVILDNGEGLFPAAYPMRHAALYFGWYAFNVTGPMATPGFRFQRGAIAAHIHSFSALTLRDPLHHWCAPLLAAGAAATIGNVFEPYLALTPHLDLFHERLRVGFTFAEAGWSAQRALSWMTTLVGDPLYQPFKMETELTRAAPDDEWAAYAAGAKLWTDDAAKAAQQLGAEAKKRRSGVVAEGLGLLQLTAAQPAAAIESFQLAREFYAHPEDAVRAAIHEIIQLRAASRTADALALTRQQIAAFPKTPAADLLRGFEAEMDPPKPKPEPSKPESASTKAETGGR